MNMILMTIPNEIINPVAHVKSYAIFSTISARRNSIKIPRRDFSSKWNTTADGDKSLIVNNDKACRSVAPYA